MGSHIAPLDGRRFSVVESQAAGGSHASPALTPVQGSGERCADDHDTIEVDDIAVHPVGCSNGHDDGDVSSPAE
jgi:hypothetical protein